jgi:type I restriction enzyme S subunit
MIADELPPGWIDASLIDVATLIMGQSPPGTSYNSAGHGLPFFQGKADFGDDHPTPRKWCTAPTRIAEPGDVLMSVRAPVGPTNIADQRCAIGRGLAAIRPRDGVPSELIRLAIQRQEAEIASWGTGSTFTAISKRHFKDIRVAVPPVELRQELVNMLGQTVKLRRSAVLHLAHARHDVDRFRQSVLTAASSGRLSADWRSKHDEPGVPSGPDFSTAAQAHASPGDNTSDFQEIPDTWAWWSVESIFQTVIDYRGRTPPHSDRGSIPHVRTTQIRNGRVDWATDRFVTKAIYDKYMTRGIPEIGDILFTMEAPLGDVGIVDRAQPFSIAQRILLLRPSQHAMAGYLAIALQSRPVQHAIENRATGSGVHGIAYKRLRSVELPIPPIAEQKDIIRRVNELIDLAESFTKRLDSASNAANSCAEPMLAKAFEDSRRTTTSDS